MDNIVDHLFVLWEEECDKEYIRHYMDEFSALLVPLAKLTQEAEQNGYRVELGMSTGSLPYVKVYSEHTNQGGEVWTV